MIEPNSPDRPGRILSARQIQLAALIIGLSFVVSGVLGLVRSAIIGAMFGAGIELDAFYAAYRLPEMLFTLVAGGALGSAFIPVFSRLAGGGDTEGAWRLASAVISLITLAALVLAALTALAAPWVVANLLIPGADPAEQALTADLMRIMLWTVVIFSASGLIMGLLNANQHFLTPALAPSMNNIGLILGAVLLSPSLGISGLAIGALLGAVLHLAVQLPAARGRGILARLKFLPDWRTPGFAEVVVLMGPRVIGQAAVQLNFVVNTALASGMKAGSLTALNYAFALMFVALGVIGQSVGTAIFPTLSLQWAQNDLDGFRRTLAGALRGVLFTSIPAMIGLALLAGALVEVLYQRGQWTPDDTAVTALALQLYALGLPAFALQEVLARAFYALRNTAIPVAVAVSGMLLNVALSLILIRVFDEPVGGLALANALATAIESAALWLLLRRRVRGLNERTVLLSAARVTAAAVIMGAAVWVVGRALAEQSALLRLVLGMVAGGLVFEVAALGVGLPEARTIPAALLRRFRR